MTQYAPLTHHLKASTESRVAMGFAEIERLLGFPLPRSARSHRPWWANSDHGHVQSRAWLDAGFASREVDLAAERLEFVRLNAMATGMAEQPPPVWAKEANPPSAPSGRHPLIGCMAGTMTVMPGVDLTEPTMSEQEIEDWLEQKTARLRGEQV